MIRYDRAPSADFSALLAPGALLAPLLMRRSVKELPLDIHLREGNHLHVYCGLTRILDVSLQSKGTVKIDATATYNRQDCAVALFREWSPSEAGFAEALEQYLNSVEVAVRHVLKEGGVQSQWSGMREPWIPFDREAVVGYKDTLAQSSGRNFPKVEAAKSEVALIAQKEGWARVPCKGTSAELDQLAVDPSGRLVLLELKFGGAGSDSIYYAPLQLLQYVHEWATVYGTLKPRLQALIEARQLLGLSPTPMPALGERLRPVLGFGDVLPSAEVQARLEKVREIANRHLPELADAIEVWTFSDSVPKRLG